MLGKRPRPLHHRHSHGAPAPSITSPAALLHRQFPPPPSSSSVPRQIVIGFDLSFAAASNPPPPSSSFSSKSSLLVDASAAAVACESPRSVLDVGASSSADLLCSSSSSRSRNGKDCSLRSMERGNELRRWSGLCSSLMEGNGGEEQGMEEARNGSKKWNEIREVAAPAVAAVVDELEEEEEEEMEGELEEASAINPALAIFSAASPPAHHLLCFPSPPPFLLLLDSCRFCASSLHRKDIFMYRGDQAFCSADCRYQQILIDES